MHAKTHHKCTWQRLGAIFVSIMLVWSFVPTASIAESTSVSEAEKIEVAQSTSESEVTKVATGSESDEQKVEEAASGSNASSSSTSEPTTASQSTEEAKSEEGKKDEEEPKSEEESKEAEKSSAKDEVKLTAQEDKKVVSVSVRVIGPDAKDKDSDWLATTTIALEKGKTAWDATKQAFDAAGLTYDASTTDYGVYLNTITSPVTKAAFGWDETTGKYWQLFVDGTAASLGASSIVASESANKEIVWYYSKYGDTLDSATETEGSTEVTTDPTATRPAYTAFWSAFRGADKRNVTDVTLPAMPGKLSWKADLKGDAAFVNVSDALVVNGNVYIAVANELRIIDGTTGETIKTAALADTIDYASRPVYDSGIVMVPLHGGRVQAFTADELVCTWISDAVPEGASSTQSLGIGAVKDGIAYFQTCIPGDTNTGYIVAVNTADGKTAWLRQNTTAGYYWDGPAFVGNAMVIADDSGTITAYNPKTGDVLSTLSVGGSVRSGVASNDDGTCVYVVNAEDGTLHKVSVSGEGALAEVGSVKFASYSTSTPTVSNGSIYVGGRNDDGTGVLAVIDEAGLAVSTTVTQAVDSAGTTASLPGEVKSSPLVMAATDATRVYFTSNNNPGALYVFTKGATTAEVLYTPDEAQQNYCLYSPVPTEDGGVLYANDSGTLFKVVQGETPVTPETPAPTITSSAGGQFASKSDVITFTITQKIPEDATSVVIWSDIAPVMHDVADGTNVEVEGGTMEVKDNRVIATINLGETPETDFLTAQAEDPSESDDHVVTVTYHAQLNDDADLTPYLNEKGTTASVPYQAHVRFNNDSNREASSSQKHLKYAAGSGDSSSSTGKSSGTTSTTKKATAKTSDQTKNVTIFIVLAIIVIGAGVFLRMKSRKDNKGSENK